MVVLTKKRNGHTSRKSRNRKIMMGGGSKVNKVIYRLMTKYKTDNSGNVNQTINNYARDAGISDINEINEIKTSIGEYLNKLSGKSKTLSKEQIEKEKAAEKARRPQTLSEFLSGREQNRQSSVKGNEPSRKIYGNPTSRPVNNAQGRLAYAQKYIPGEVKRIKEEIIRRQEEANKRVAGQGVNSTNEGVEYASIVPPKKSKQEKTTDTNAKNSNYNRNINYATLNFKTQKFEPNKPTNTTPLLSNENGKPSNGVFKNLFEFVKKRFKTRKNRDPLITTNRQLNALVPEPDRSPNNNMYITNAINSPVLFLHQTTKNKKKKSSVRFSTAGNTTHELKSPKKITTYKPNSPENIAQRYEEAKTLLGLRILGPPTQTPQKTAMRTTQTGQITISPEQQQELDRIAFRNFLNKYKDLISDYSPANLVKQLQKRLATTPDNNISDLPINKSNSEAFINRFKNMSEQHLLDIISNVNRENTHPISFNNLPKTNKQRDFNTRLQEIKNRQMPIIDFFAKRKRSLNAEKLVRETLEQNSSVNTKNARNVLTKKQYNSATERARILKEQNARSEEARQTAQENLNSRADKIVGSNKSTSEIIKEMKKEASLQEALAQQREQFKLKKGQIPNPPIKLGQAPEALNAKNSEPNLATSKTVTVANPLSATVYSVPLESENTITTTAIKNASPKPVNSATVTVTKPAMFGAPVYSVPLESKNTGASAPAQAPLPPLPPLPPLQPKKLPIPFIESPARAIERALNNPLPPLPNETPAATALFTTTQPALVQLKTNQQDAENKLNVLKQQIEEQNKEFESNVKRKEDSIKYYNELITQMNERITRYSSNKNLNGSPKKKNNKNYNVKKIYSVNQNKAYYEAEILKKKSALAKEKKELQLQQKQQLTKAQQLLFNSTPTTPQTVTHFNTVPSINPWRNSVEVAVGLSREQRVLPTNKDMIKGAVFYPAGIPSNLFPHGPTKYMPTPQNLTNKGKRLSLAGVGQKYFPRTTSAYRRIIENRRTRKVSKTAAKAAKAATKA